MQSVLPIKVGKNSFMTDYNLPPVWCARMYDEQSSTLSCRSLPWRGMEGIPIYLAYKGVQKFHYDWLRPISNVTSQNVCPKIGNALLTHISNLGKGQ